MDVDNYIPNLESKEAQSEGAARNSGWEFWTGGHEGGRALGKLILSLGWWLAVEAMERPEAEPFGGEVCGVEEPEGHAEELDPVAHAGEEGGWNGQ